MEPIGDHFPTSIDGKHTSEDKSVLVQARQLEDKVPHELRIEHPGFVD